MKTKLIAILLVLMTSQVGHASACSVCFGAPGSKSSASIGVAIWFLMGAVMSVLGGVGAFGFHLWRHARMPLEPHQELAEEDLNQYD